MKSFYTCVCRVSAGGAFSLRRVLVPAQITYKVRRRFSERTQCSVWKQIPLRFLLAVTAVTELDIDLDHVIPAATAVIIPLRQAVLQHLIVALADWKNAKDEANPYVVKTIMCLEDSRMLSYFILKKAHRFSNFIIIDIFCGQGVLCDYKYKKMINICVFNLMII